MGHKKAEELLKESLAIELENPAWNYAAIELALQSIASSLIDVRNSLREISIFIEQGS